MALYAIIAFIIYGWVEFEAMAHVVDAIGGLLAFIGIFVTAMVGIHLLRSQSAKVMAQFRADIAKGQVKSTAIASSISLLAGAVLMLIPGYVTDFLGFLCFIPGLRRMIGSFIIARFNHGLMARASQFSGARFSQGGFSHNNFEQNDTYTKSSHAKNSHHRTTQQPKVPSDNDIIEGEFKEKNE